MSSWITLLSAAVGGLVGGGIPATMTYRASRQQQQERRQGRQWQDAEVLAEVYRLLVDIDPARRGMSVSRTPGAEDDRWAGIGRRSDEVRTQLLRLASGHPSVEVQSLARDLEVELSKAVSFSRNYIDDLLRNRDTPEGLRAAQECHESAVAAAGALDAAVKTAGAG